jgi:methyltransferase (TIGR00027 family)
MSSEPHRISHVSDTALMTAACRAAETDRPDGWIRDPFARRLAGERGMAIAEGMPGIEVMCFGVGMRSRLLDDLVMQTVGQHGIRTVLSVGAGLDSRPFRLDLPPNLVWIEADLPPMLAYKSEILQGEQPNCRLERMPTDVIDPDQRRAVFHAAAEPALMITEGLLMYLPAPVVRAIATDAVAGGIRYWMLDISTKALARSIRRDRFKDIEAVRAPDNLDGEGIMNVAKECGWQPIESRSYTAVAMTMMPPGRMESMMRLRMNAGADYPAPPPPGDISGVHLLSRDSAPN